MPKLTREYIDRLAAEISKRDGVITNKEVWAASRYLKVSVEQVRVIFHVRCSNAFRTNILLQAWLEPRIYAEQDSAGINASPDRSAVEQEGNADVLELARVLHGLGDEGIEDLV
jgi:hypothetical protein